VTTDSKAMMSGYKANVTQGKYRAKQRQAMKDNDGQQKAKATTPDNNV
jgi:hypothetical protein